MIKKTIPLSKILISLATLFFITAGILIFWQIPIKYIFYDASRKEIIPIEITFPTLRIKDCSFSFVLNSRKFLSNEYLTEAGSILEKSINILDNRDSVSFTREKSDWIVDKNFLAQITFENCINKDGQSAILTLKNIENLKSFEYDLLLKETSWAADGFQFNMYSIIIIISSLSIFCFLWWIHLKIQNLWKEYLWGKVLIILNILLMIIVLIIPLFYFFIFVVLVALSIWTWISSLFYEF